VANLPLNAIPWGAAAHSAGDAPERSSPLAAPAGRRRKLLICIVIGFCLPTTAKLKGGACVEEIDYRTARGLDKSVIRALAQQSTWVANHENIFVLGPTGVGKSFVACALAQKACRDGYSAFYTRAAALFRDLAIARADGSLRTLLARLGRVDVLVIDDWAMAPLNEAERRDFWEICEDRYQTRSTVLTSQLPVARWHEQIGDPTAADGILDRLVHNAHRLDMRGDSMRKKRGAQPSS